MFEQIRWALDNILGLNSNVFTIRKNVSPENIETCKGAAVEDENTRTCALCVALNDTVFKNNNKPEYYHPNCKCKIKEYNLREVKLDFPIEKITKYLFVKSDKKAIMQSMGYYPEDAEYIYNLMAENAREKFLKGDYSLGVLDEHGQVVNIVLELEGKGTKKGKTYKFKTGWTAYPYGKLHNNTPHGGWIKEK